MKRKLVSILLFLICIGINFYFRIIPSYLPQLKEKAKEEIKVRSLQSVYKLIKDKYPQLNPVTKEELVREVAREIERDKKNELEKMIEKRYKVLKDYFQDENNQTYFIGVDSYHWIRCVENVLKNGYPGTRKEKGIVYDDFMLAPIGIPPALGYFFFYISAFLYKIFTFFKNIALFRFLSWLPLFYSFIFLGLIYLCIRFLSNDLGAFFGTLFIGLGNFIVNRSCVGWFDYDMLVLTFPLGIVVLLCLSVKKDVNRILSIFFSLLAAFLLEIYFDTWRVGYWWIVVVVGGFYLYSIINIYFINKRYSKEILNYFISACVFLAGGVFFCYLLHQENLIKDIFLKVKENIKLGTPFTESIWPNVYYTVSELRKSSSKQIVNYLYGNFICLFSLACGLYVFIRERRSHKKDILYMMILWMIFMFFAAFKSIRFVGFLSVPLGMFFGTFVGDISRRISKAKDLSKTKFLAYSISFGIFLLYSGGVFLKNASKTMKTIYPHMNDRWYKALMYIKKNTSKDSIINSWWDYGSFFKTVGRRRVIFDGQTQNRPLAYWMAQVLLSNDENKAIRILRMMNNSSDRLFSVLNEYIKDPCRCLVFLKKLLNSNKEEAEDMLKKNNLPPHVVKKSLESLFSTPAPAYFVVDKSMIGKISSISFVGNWDFRKVYIRKGISAYRKKEEILKGLEKMFGTKRLEAQRLLEEVIIMEGTKDFYEVFSQRERFYSFLSKGYKKENLVYFDNGVVYDMLGNFAIFFSSDVGEYKIPKVLFVFKDGKIQKKVLDNSNSEICVLVILGKGKYESILLDQGLGDSLLVRLFFLKGEGLKYFEPFYLDEKKEIYVFKIKWNLSKAHSSKFKLYLPQPQRGCKDE